MASTADYRSFSAKREGHTGVHTGTNSSELHYVLLRVQYKWMLLIMCDCKQVPLIKLNHSNQDLNKKKIAKRNFQSFDFFFF